MNLPKTNEECEVFRSEIEKQRRRHQVTGYVVKTVMVLSYILSPILALWFLLTGIVGPGLFNPSSDKVGYSIFVLVYALFFIIPCLICLPLILRWAVKQNPMPRIVVLRKFKSSESQKALRKIIKNSLGNCGHVFTLSDNRFKVKWYVRIPAFIGQLSLFHFRQRIIRKPAQLVKFKKALLQRTWLNISWYLSMQKLFTVKSSDSMWRATASTLMEKSDLVLFDISYKSDSLEWEALEVKKLDLESKVVAVASEKRQSEALLWIEQFRKNSGKDVPVFFYDAKQQIIQKDEFEDCVVNKLMQSTQTEDLQFSIKYARRRTVKTIAATFFVFLFPLFFISPYVFPEFVSRHSLFVKQSLNGYIQVKLKNKLSEREMEQIRERIQNTWPAEAASAVIDLAFHPDNAETEAICSLFREFVYAPELPRYKQLALSNQSNIANAALNVILELPPVGMDTFAMDLLSSQNLSTNMRSVKVLERVKIDQSIATRTLLTIVQRHETPDTPSIHDTNLDRNQPESEYLCSLYKLLYDSIDSTHLGMLEKIQSENRLLRNRILAGLLLAKLNDGSGISSLLIAMQTSGSERLWQPFFVASIPTNAPPQSYGELAEANMFKLRNAANMPYLSLLMNQLNNLTITIGGENNRIARDLIIVIVRNYTADDFAKLLHEWPAITDELPEALRYIMVHDSSQLDKLKKVIQVSKQYLRQNFRGKNNCQKRRSAWLLALIGDSSVARFVVEDRNSRSIGSQTRDTIYQCQSYDEMEPDYGRSEGRAILETLYSNLRPPCDSRSYVELKKDSPLDLENIFDRIIQKAKIYSFKK